mmetsp:Transcript_52/g.185  ORF Transcript_52/g.185 Transcript_52/m.185 type:complete len:245 (-) Transcript_52:1523-2257(-)
MRTASSRITPAAVWCPAAAAATATWRVPERVPSITRDRTGTSRTNRRSPSTTTNPRSDRSTTPIDGRLEDLGDVFTNVSALTFYQNFNRWILAQAETKRRFTRLSRSRGDLTPTLVDSSRFLLGAHAAVNLERLLDVRLRAPRPFKLFDGDVEQRPPLLPEPGAHLRLLEQGVSPHDLNLRSHARLLRLLLLALLLLLFGLLLLDRLGRLGGILRKDREHGVEIGARSGEFSLRLVAVPVTLGR